MDGFFKSVLVGEEEVTEVRVSVEAEKDDLRLNNIVVVGCEVLVVLVAGMLGEVCGCLKSEGLTVHLAKVYIRLDETGAYRLVCHRTRLDSARHCIAGARRTLHPGQG